MEPAVGIPLKWVRAKQYALISGYSEDAIKKKRDDGIWREGVEWVRAPDGRIMVNPKAIDEWVESGNRLH